MIYKVVRSGILEVAIDCVDPRSVGNECRLRGRERSWIKWNERLVSKQRHDDAVSLDRQMNEFGAEHPESAACAEAFLKVFSQEVTRNTYY